MVTKTLVIVQWYCVVLDFIAVTTTVDIVQYFCVVCGVYCDYFRYGNIRCSAILLFCFVVNCGYSNSRYSAMLLGSVWMLLRLQQQ